MVRSGRLEVSRGGDVVHGEDYRAMPPAVLGGRLTDELGRFGYSDLVWAVCQVWRVLEGFEFVLICIFFTRPNAPSPGSCSLRAAQIDRLAPCWQPAATERW